MSLDVTYAPSGDIHVPSWCASYLDDLGTEVANARGQSASDAIGRLAEYLGELLVEERHSGRSRLRRLNDIIALAAKDVEV